MSLKKISSSWKRKQVKKAVRSAERPRFRLKEMKGTGNNWGTQFHNTFNRSDKRLLKKHSQSK